MVNSCSVIYIKNFDINIFSNYIIRTDIFNIHFGTTCNKIHIFLSGNIFYKGITRKLGIYRTVIRNQITYVSIVSITQTFYIDTSFLGFHINTISIRYRLISKRICINLVYITFCRIKSNSVIKFSDISRSQYRYSITLNISL